MISKFLYNPRRSLDIYQRARYGWGFPVIIDFDSGGDRLSGFNVEGIEHLHPHPRFFLSENISRLSFSGLPLVVAYDRVSNHDSKRGYFEPQFDAAYASEEIEPKKVEGSLNTLYRFVRVFCLVLFSLFFFALGLTVLHSQIPRSRNAGAVMKSGLLGLAFIFIGGVFIWIILQT